MGDIIGGNRWADGTTGGAFYSDPEKTFTANQRWHVLAGAPVTNMPTTGTVTYGLVGSTEPTIRDGSLTPGSFSGNLAVAFGATPVVGLGFAVDIGGNSYSFGTAGGAADAGNGGRPLETSGDFAFTFGANDLPVTGAGGVCGGAGDCNAVGSTACALFVPDDKTHDQNAASSGFGANGTFPSAGKGAGVCSSA